MINLRELSDRYKEIEQNIQDRYMKVDLSRLLELQAKRSELIQRSESLRTIRNEHSKMMKGKMSPEERAELVAKGKSIKEDIAKEEALLTKVEEEFTALASLVPNYAHPDAPRGKEDKDNTEIKRWGNPRTFQFTPKDHVALGTELGIIDFEQAARVSGQKFYYLMGAGAFLDMALSRYAMDLIAKRGFTPTITPDIARTDILEAIGFNPRGEESNIYTIEDTDTCLIGTAEVPLGGYYGGRIFSPEELPIRMAGLSHCFRREAGASGQYSKGLYRVHQFTKVEMFVFCAPEESEKFHQEILEIEEELFQGLEIPYRVVDTCTGDLGAPAYRKFDIEAWMPGRGESGDWGEVTSTSNCTDYQARRLGIRIKDDNGIQYAHMLNGTAIAISRAIVAILENHQQEDGSIRIPKKLIPYMGCETITR